jgi:thiopurine S-methyltransferase
MDPQFWHQRWETNQIGFHGSKPNPQLVAHFDALSLAQDSRVFVPLCGKTLDIGWLLANGYRIAGAELSELAITQLFAELGIEPQVTELGAHKRYSAPDIDIFVGDIFDLSGETLGAVDAIYDRAALVALPENMRGRYTKHLTAMTKRAPQLLITFDYDQSLMQGPPFAVSDEEVSRHYTGVYEIAHLATAEVTSGRLENFAAKENVWLLKRS